MEQATATPDITLKEDPVWKPPLDQNKKISVTMDIRASDYPKLQAWMQSDTYERAEAIRNAERAKWIDSVAYAVKYASEEDGAGAEVFATFLASLYNGHRVKADLSDITRLDRANFEHMMNIMRLCFSTRQEPHSFFKNGNAIFEHIIKRHGLEKRRKS